jgi:hypothetical protein
MAGLLLVKNYKCGKFVVDSIIAGLYINFGLDFFAYYMSIVHINLMEMPLSRRLM